MVFDENGIARCINAEERGAKAIHIFDITPGTYLNSEMYNHIPDNGKREVFRKVVAAIKAQQSEFKRLAEKENAIKNNIEERLDVLQKRMAVTDVQRLISVGTKAVLTITLIGALTTFIRIMMREFAEISRTDRLELVATLVAAKILNPNSEETTAVKILVDDEYLFKEVKLQHPSAILKHVLEQVSEIVKSVGRKTPEN